MENGKILNCSLQHMRNSQITLGTGVLEYRACLSESSRIFGISDEHAFRKSEAFPLVWVYYEASKSS